MAAVIVWGAYLAFGALANSGERSARPVLKGSIMLVAFLGFIGFWSLMLRQRQRDLREDEEE
jgi:hypothetical protein